MAEDFHDFHDCICRGGVVKTLKPKGYDDPEYQRVCYIDDKEFKGPVRQAKCYPKEKFPEYHKRSPKPSPSPKKSPSRTHKCCCHTTIIINSDKIKKSYKKQPKCPAGYEHRRNKDGSWSKRLYKKK